MSSEPFLVSIEQVKYDDFLCSNFKNSKKKYNTCGSQGTQRLGQFSFADSLNS